MPLRATSFVRAAFVMETPWGMISLDATERHLRRKLFTLENGTEILIDLPQAVKLEGNDCLVLDDGRLIRIVATSEDLMEVRARNSAHLVQLAWHIGNRHLEAQIEQDRILIRADKVIGQMLEHQGATLRAVHEVFTPEHGAYHSHGHETHDH